MNNTFNKTGVALVTPFTPDGKIDFNALRKLVRYQIDNGTNFLVVQGTTGESPVLSQDEKMAVLNTVQEENNGRLQIVYGLGGNNTMDISSKLKELPKGVDGILSVSPYYNKPSQQGIIEHFKVIADSTDLPIILYNVPGRTSSNMMAETTLALAEVENVVAVKEASGDLMQVMEIIKHAPEGFEVVSGDDALTVPMMVLGATGVISVVANAFPAKFSRMIDAAYAGDFDSARSLHFELLNITNLFFKEGNPGGVKASLAAQNLMEETMRLPLFPISDGLRSKISNETKILISG